MSVVKSTAMLLGVRCTADLAWCDEQPDFETAWANMDPSRMAWLLVKVGFPQAEVVAPVLETAENYPDLLAKLKWELRWVNQFMAACNAVGMYLAYTDLPPETLRDVYHSLFDYDQVMGKLRETVARMLPEALVSTTEPG